MAKETTTAIAATTDTKVLAAERKERAAHVGMGSENVTASDMAIPRLKLLQLTNPEILKGNPAFVEGAQAGMILNTVTNELYSAVNVVNLHFSRRTVAWHKRVSEGGTGEGIFGQYDDEVEAKAAIEEAGKDPSKFDISENPTHLVMVLDDEGNPKGVALLDMPGTKIKVSKVWNSRIAEQEQAGNPRFGCVWELDVTATSNAKGNYFNYSVDLLVAHAPKSIYDQAQASYSAFFGGAANQATHEEDAA